MRLRGRSTVRRRFSVREREIRPSPEFEGGIARGGPNRDGVDPIGRGDSECPARVGGGQCPSESTEGRD